MNYEQAKKLKPDEFKRLCGVPPQTFKQMVKIVEKQAKAKKKTGRPSKLSRENQILMTLEYLREYRTYFHIGRSWGLDESNVYRTIKKIENILIREKNFRLQASKRIIQRK